MSGLDAAQLAIFAVLSLPVLYLIYSHGRRGFLGWGFLLVFCILRLTGAGMAIGNSGPAAQIISSIGLSPMLLSLDGILHEARTYRYATLNKGIEYPFMAVFHILIVAGVALVGSGAGGLTSETPEAKDLTHVKVGMALLEIGWGILVLWTLWTLKERSHPVETAREGSALLYGVLVALLVEEIQLVYSLVAQCTQRADLNPTTGNLAVRVVLGFLPGVAATVVLVVVGVWTRSVSVSKEVAGRDSGRSGWV
ncbi:uncharacterized protein APUU_50159A [Aspergillus puulaauensis]|uniref:DUF7702 domain-containing protein n=1 Tax=Aspergillus puulaauensis TaxID=1220207 RepID=A0A7R8AQ34_9EURO|nr:uncharacterized protein APUU_50159A [Aspergillus puulaauensis]BCS25448.1 hypothetical protein APUU_50159A [Aspergillus puulaauensis]